MKKLITIAIILLTLFTLSCATDCSKCATIVKPKVIVPTLACYVPDSFATLQSKLLSPMEATTEGELTQINAINSKMLELNIVLWEGYRTCVNIIIKSYDEVKNTIENPVEVKK